MYDDGPAALRLRRLARLEELGLIPKDTTPHPVVNALKIPEWDDMDDEQKKSSSRAMETYAAMVEHIDEAVGRAVDKLDELGIVDNTVYNKNLKRRLERLIICRLFYSCRIMEQRGVRMRPCPIWELGTSMGVWVHI